MCADIVAKSGAQPTRKVWRKLGANESNDRDQQHDDLHDSSHALDLSPLVVLSESLEGTKAINERQRLRRLDEAKCDRAPPNHLARCFGDHDDRDATRLTRRFHSSSLAPISSSF